MITKISVQGMDVEFDCDEQETVLDAAERAGFAIPYSCRKGVCSTCEGGIVSGEAQVRGQGHCVGPMEGVRLCQARPRSDLIIAPVSIRKEGPIDRKFLQAKVRKITRPTADVVVIRLRFPTGVRAPFQAGQYLRVMIPGGESRNYSMANPPQQNDGLELHIRHIPGGKFSEDVLAKLDKGSVLDVELPYGEFKLTKEEERQAIMLASGTGFAPIRSIIDDQIRKGTERRMHLYWGANTDTDLYDRNLAEHWAKANDWFIFTPVVSSPGTNWKGRKGFVHQAVLEDYPDMREVEVYACGAPVMIDAALADFCAKAGLRRENFHSDVFVASGNAQLDSDQFGLGSARNNVK